MLYCCRLNAEDRRLHLSSIKPDLKRDLQKYQLFFIKICFLIFTRNGFIVIFKQINKYFKILSVLVSNTLNTDRDDLHKVKLSLDLTNLKSVKVVLAQKV